MWFVAFVLGCGAPELTEAPEGSRKFGFAGFDLWKSTGEVVPLMKLNKVDGYVPKRDDVFTFHPRIEEWPDAKVEGVCQLRAGRLRYCTWNFQATHQTLDSIEKAVIDAVVGDPYDDLTPITPTSNEVAERRFEWKLDTWSDIVVVRTREEEGKAVPFVGLTYGRQAD